MSARGGGPRAPLRGAALSLLGALLIAAGAQVRVPLPMVLPSAQPAPFTLQTLALLVLAGVWGRLGALAALLYLAGVLAGLPLLAGGALAPGLRFLSLRSGGYVVGFVPAALLTAWWLGREAGRPRRWPRRALAVLGGLIGGHGVVLLCGALWLWPRGGGAAALLAQLPLLPGMVLKSALGAALVLSLRAWGPRESQRGP